MSVTGKRKKMCENEDKNEDIIPKKKAKTEDIKGNIECKDDGLINKIEINFEKIRRNGSPFMCPLCPLKFDEFNALKKHWYCIHHERYFKNDGNGSKKLSKKEKRLQRRKQNEIIKINSKPPAKGKDRMTPLPSYYLIVNNLRYIAPYNFDYKCYVKGRWIGKNIYDVFCKEFIAYDSEYYKNAIENGTIKVNDNIVGLNYILKNNEYISHFVHRHEPPVFNININIIYECNDYIVIDKPASIPVHPTGKYRFNTIVYILYNDINSKYKNIHLFACNRLDRVTSGLMILCKNSRFAAEFSNKLKNNEIMKTYIARVMGHFKHNDIQVNKPIYCKDPRTGIHEINEEKGKESITHFSLIKYDKNTDTSLVKCKPITGRTHQIRIHLQYLNHPIANDMVYGGNNKYCINIINTKDNEYFKRHNDILMKNIIKHYDNDCNECKLIKDELTDGNDVEIRNGFAQIWLHSYKYQSKQWCYQTKIPKWAQIIQHDF